MPSKDLRMPMTTPAAGEQIGAPERVPSGCPVIHLDASAPLEAGSHWRRPTSCGRPARRSSTPTRRATGSSRGTTRCARCTSTRRSSPASRSPRGSPDPVYRFVPTQIDPPEHAKYRQLISRWFAPNAVGRIAPQAHEIGRRLVADLAPRGECDFVTDFAMRLPTEIFLTIIGVPELRRRPVRPVGRGLLRRLRRRPRAAAGDGRGPRRDPAVLGRRAGGSPRRGAAPRERLRLASPALHRRRRSRWTTR